LTGERIQVATIIVGGALANKYLNGGEAWVRLNWALGFQKLGFKVYLVEQISRESCVDSAGAVTAFDDCVNLAYFKQVTEEFGLSNSSALIYANGEQVYGLSYSELLDVASTADLLVNITGHLKLEPLTSLPRRKAYIDLDPGYTQFWQTTGNTGARLEGHDFYFTVGENIGTPACSIPTGGILWRPIPQPVVLEHWQVSPEGTHDRFTTIASWRGGYGPAQYGDKSFGVKAHEFRKFIELPQRSAQTFEIALDIHPAETKDLALLHENKWKLVDPKQVAPDPSSFRRYVQTSGAEFSPAQGVYVETDSGWFSDRTVRYLASGKPALVQETGFSRNYPVGDGLLAFSTLDQAIAGAELIARDYDKHCQSARALAEEYFDSDKVLGRLVEEIGVAP
jgi:hypothetical protein